MAVAHDVAPIIFFFISQQKGAPCCLCLSRPLPFLSSSALSTGSVLVLYFEGPQRK